ncbi:MAG: hypothetical protein US54_C0019G0002 [Candidatus Roizmanbacteria bacterium GW2011_GWA2_37_7]|uniref:Uncharacterized protein n=1 Tax=Candidatus Roizmanbacteria bacterium GW2011_GWA2_37_7 TaxID=1618481 RepID=A0A0G0H471_9BACT|nr:MAG: hypothetical protein US54_C0019G0002 [Candidatus Roizmanbacteria bacterium GW2011_GWA2_37_7]
MYATQRAVTINIYQVIDGRALRACPSQLLTYHPLGMKWTGIAVQYKEEK